MDHSIPLCLLPCHRRHRRGLLPRHRLDRPGPWSSYPFLEGLQREGGTDYLAILSPFGDPVTAIERRDGIICSWLTDKPGGFSDEEVTVIRRLQPRLAVVGKVVKRERTAVSLAAAYLGVDAGRRVLEGRIRRGDSDVVRAVQQARKSADFHVSDRISLHLALPGDWGAAVESFRDYVSEQTLATELKISSGGEMPGAAGSHRERAKLGEHEIEIELSRAS